MSQWIELFGRLHPMVLHLPIGLIVGLVAVELLGFLRRKPIAHELAGGLVWLAAGVSVVSAGTGYVLSLEGDHSGPTLDNHLILGIVVAVASVLTAILHAWVKPVALYRASLLITAGLLIPTGHLGASMTHGEDFLFEPLRGEGSQVRMANADTALATGGQRYEESVAPGFADAIAPIFAERCGSCHGELRQRGGLALHTPETIRKGGKHGAALVAAKPGESEMVRRLRLPSDADGHMPPASKPQPSEEELAAIEAWIAAGADFGTDAADAIVAIDAGNAEAGASNGGGADATEYADAGSRLPRVAAAPPQAIEALRRKLVHVEPLGRGSNLLWVDFAAIAPQATDAEVAELLEPLREQVSSLSLARTKISDASAAILAKMLNLAQLDLRATAVTDATVATIAGLERLEELVLSQANLTDAAVDSLRALPALKRVHLWKAGVGDEALARLRSDRPELVVVAGDEAEAAAQETEGELKFTSGAPIPGQPATASLTPVNTKCPVSGSPVDPRYLIVYKGRVVGFCCQNCPKEFWAEPAKFEARIE